MKILLRVLQYIYFGYAAFLFLFVMFLILPLIFIASFFGTRGGNIIYYFLHLWADIWFPMIGIFFKKIYEVPLDKNSVVIYVVNHSCYLDAAMIVKVIPQPFRPLGKVEMAKIPFFGFIYKHAVVMVDRSSARDRAQSVQQLKEVLLEKISVLIFPEGTINQTRKPLKSFYDGAFSMAIKNKVPIQPVLFLDNARRMRPSNVLSLNPGRARILYLEKINVEEFTLRDLPLLKGKVHAAMEAAIKKYR
jgi:1-acyl-sn-glycerol-3-phosphate acyltransferase